MSVDILIRILVGGWLTVMGSVWLVQDLRKKNKIIYVLGYGKRAYIMLLGASLFLIVGGLLIILGVI